MFLEYAIQLFGEPEKGDMGYTKLEDFFAELESSGSTYTSTLDIVSMYVDQFSVKELRPDMSRDIASKYNIPIYGSIEEALKCGGSDFALDGILLIGEHGDYPKNEFNQILYPRRRFFEECLNGRE